MAWSEKLPSGKYRGVYRDGAGKRRSAGTFTHKAKAEREAAAKESKARKKLWSDPEAYKRPWETWADEWWPTRNVEASTLKRDENRRRHHLDPRWTGVPLGSIRRHDVKAWAAQMRTDGVGPSTVQRAIHLFSASLAAAVDAEILEFNPAARIKLPKGQVAGERFLTEAEYDAVRDHLPTTHDQLITDVLVGTGMRWGELAGLHRSRVDLDRKVVYVVETYNEDASTIKPYPKGRRPREVPLSNDLVRALRKYLKASPAALLCGVEHTAGRCSGALLFTTETGRPLRNSNWSPVWRRAVEDAGVGHARVYDLRHTFASWLLQRGVSLAEVGQLMGHVSPATTAIYARLAKEPSAAAREALNAPRKPHGKSKKRAS